MKFIYTLKLIIFTALGLSAQIVINEYSASNINSYLDDWGKSEDWIELYNTSDADFDLSEYHISDKMDNPTKWAFPDGSIIEANGFLVVWCSGRDGRIKGRLNTNFKLTQTTGKDEIVFADPSGEIIESTSMELTLVEHSICKEIDGGSNWKICPNTTLRSTNNNVQKYDRYTTAPSMDLEAGFYQDSVTVSLINNDPGTTLRYTMDGSNPKTTSPEYTEPITISTTAVIKAQSFTNSDNILTGKMDFNTYFIDEDNFSVAVFSVAADNVVNLANGNGILIPIGSLEYFNTEKEREAVSFGSLNRHGQDSWVLPHRSLDWISRDEMGYSKAVDAKLFSFIDRDEYQKFMFRNSGDDNYPAIDDGNHEFSTHIRDEYVQTLALEGNMKLDTRAVERVVLFLNGQYWGLYGMRDRPVDHDYTSEYYDQGKYDLHYLSTWGTTETQYGGQPALDDWVQLRDFILTNDMSIDSNYQIVKDQYSTLSLIDYMLMNLNVVAKDWLNYNTGWWKGLNPDGDHKKWGYILWDLDATFDYYINYTGVPNETASAEICDIEDIADFVDGFFGGGGGPGWENCPSVQSPNFPHETNDPIVGQVINMEFNCCFNWSDNCEALYEELAEELDPENCFSITNGDSPYPADDSIFQLVIAADSWCCESGWDDTCEGLYEQFANQTGTGGDSVYDGELENIGGNVGSHEKILLKLIEENPDFRQQYFSRQADLMNTVFSCENMNETLERMLDVIRPEMPRQISRWGGTLNEWESNVDRLRDFINERCEFLGEAMTNCYDITGPFEVTIMTQPEGVGDDINFNSLKIDEFPWTGDYFGDMENIIEADKKDGDYRFSHWVSTQGNIITPNELERKARLTLSGPDTLIAVYSMSTATEDFALSNSINIFPNPSASRVNIGIDLDVSATVKIDLYSTMGKMIRNITPARTIGTSRDVVTIDMDELDIPHGMYIFKIHVDDKIVTKRVTFIK